MSDLDAARGPSYEFRGYNVDHSESQEHFREGIRVCQGLWTTPGFTYEGKYIQLDRANLVPPPMQQPHPPIFIAATRTQETLEFEVSTRYPTIVGNVQYTDEALDLCRRFTEMSKKSGHNVPMSSIPSSGTCRWPKPKSRLARTLSVPCIGCWISCNGAGPSTGAARSTSIWRIGGGIGPICP